MALPLGLQSTRPPLPGSPPPAPGLADMLSGGAPPPLAPPQSQVPSFDAQQVAPPGPPSTNLPAVMAGLQPTLMQQAADVEALKATQAQVVAAAMAMAQSQDANPLAAAAPSLPGEPTAPGGGFPQ